MIEIKTATRVNPYAYSRKSCKLGCSFSQGYLHHAAMSRRDLDQVLARGENLEETAPEQNTRILRL